MKLTTGQLMCLKNLRKEMILFELLMIKVNNYPPVHTRMRDYLFFVTYGYKYMYIVLPCGKHQQQAERFAIP